MINLFIDKPNKVSGRYSVFILSDYNEKLIDIIKQCSISKFDKKTKLWEVSINDLAFVLDNITYFDDIRLILPEEDDVEDVIYPKLVKDYTFSPMPYQYDGIVYGLNHNKWLLLDDMGLGKTYQLIHIAEELKALGKIEHCLIICCINTIKTNWKSEIEKHSNLTCRILGEKISKNGKISYKKISERAEELKNKIDEFFIITNIESFRDDRMVEAFNKSVNKIGMLVADEIHKCKNPRTRGDKACQQSSNLLKLDSDYKIAATGTLLLNSPVDSLVPLKWIGVEHSTLTDFKAQYCILDDEFKAIGYKNLELLKDEIECNSLRRTKELLKDQLPPKMIVNEYVDMNDSHKKFYDTIASGVKSEIKDAVDKVNIDSRSLLGMIVRLRQASVLPSILTTQNIASSKIERAVDITEQLLSNGRKVVIFSNFKEPCYKLEELLKDYNPLVVTGDSKEQDISERINKFNTDVNYKIFICTIAKCGTGLSLHKQCSDAIFLDCDWTAGLQAQAEDRINRLGSTMPATIYRLICSGTIDEMISFVLKKKELMSDYVIDDGSKIDDEALKILQKYILDL